jgi:hypothetical protein
MVVRQSENHGMVGAIASTMNTARLEVVAEIAQALVDIAESSNSADGVIYARAAEIVVRFGDQIK